MPPLHLKPNARDTTNAPVQPMALAPAASPVARQFKILQSRRAPAQLTLALHRS